mmetsp:Transcript_15497/g.35700  ORF Transcript_15497/g.35700 Transcript_15497/m.35700 type:complete len:238 (-) Transcript_15497:1628-2341(-)
MLLLHHVWLGQQQDRDRSESEKEEEVLYFGLTSIQRLVNISRCKSNVDQRSNEIGRLATVSRPTVVKRALVGSGIVVRTAVTPWSAVSISRLIAQCPVILPIIAVRVEASSGKHTFVPVDTPLHEDQDNHVDKQGSSENNHRKDFEIQVEFLPKIDGVDTLQDRTEKHLDDTENHTQLHLERVEEKKFVRRDVPHGIQTEWVNGFVRTVFSGLIGDVSFFHLHAFLTIEFPTTTEEV